jgi:inhibitor of KinA sporulation pathway (predicted exonuclease)
LNAIVFDLELIKRYKKGQLSEIVEIGACKVDLQSKMITDQFQIYTLPTSGYVTKSTRKFINMEKEDVKKAVKFEMGIQRFVRWLGDHYFLCSWGKDDKLHFVNQCVRNKMNLDWLRNYNNIQQQIGKLLTATNSKNQMGLKTALGLAGIQPVGKAHRGIDDAINTAELLIKFADQIELEHNTLSTKETAPPKANRKRILRHKLDSNQQRPRKIIRKG